MTKDLILASASPRRRELLDQIGVNYQVYPVDIDETPRSGELVEKYVVRMASEKAFACIDQVGSDCPVLAADTCISVDGLILGKPENQSHAEQMLCQLSGKTHQVFSAVSICCTDQKLGLIHDRKLVKTDVTFRELDLDEIQAYWNSGEPQDKAGAYAIQGVASVFVESIRGSFSGVVGLPLFETAQLLAKQGIKIIK